MSTNNRASPALLPGARKSRRTGLRLFLAACCVLALGSAVLAQSGSTYNLEWNVFSSSGGNAAGSTYQMDFSLAQPSVVGTSAGDTYRVLHGFWQYASEPTGIVLASFTAAPSGGGILVQWETASEFDVAGFNLLRGEAEGGPYAQLNPDLIPAQGGPTQPAGYGYDDAGVTAGVTYYYRLQVVDTLGQETLYGPVWATLGGSGLYLPLVTR
jgi:hypothetical protein